MTPALGVCYYPEHWPEDTWASDAERMRSAGIEWVRIGEFAWSRLEPAPGQLEFAWLDRAIDTLGTAGLNVVLGTPTATPPRWMLDRYPDMLARGADGHLRKFGSRRHYCFSHIEYLQECKRIATLLGERYGRNPFVKAWQIDNEYGCHDTVVSYSDNARNAFRLWLQKRYGSIDALNRAWGNVFWSMEYVSFDQVDLPNQTVTEPNPAHVLAFRRFSSDQVVSFNRVQVDALRSLTTAPLIHNYMGRILEFDHFAVGDDLDIASWDSYPIGFLSDRLRASEEHKKAYLRQGDPDMQAFHHDLYRAVGKGRWWVMEQQPGPVNWAPYNPAPLPGMVALWSLEAFAHGAEVVTYFRWRQAPFGQEQHHAGLLIHDGRDAPGLAELEKVRALTEGVEAGQPTSVPVALVFDYASDWAWKTQPQGAGFDYFDLMLSCYSACRKLGLSVDILPPSHRSFDGYDVVFAPGLATLESDLVAAISEAGAQLVLGPRTGAITEEFSIPSDGRPGTKALDVNVDLVESLPPSDKAGAVTGGGSINHWLEHISGEADVLMSLKSGLPALVEKDRVYYIAGCPDDDLWARILRLLAEKCGLTLRDLPPGLRVRKLGTNEFWINYNAHAVEFDGLTMAACDVALRESDVF